MITKTIDKILIALAILFSCYAQAEFFFTPVNISSHLQGYSEKEINLIKKDLEIVRSITLEDTKNTERPFYLATAGAPGSHKTTILEKFVSEHPEYQEGVYVDPDTRSLKFMAHTYYAKSLNPLVIAQTGDYDQVIKNAYDKWRGGSNYIALNVLEEAFGKGRSIIHGATSTGAHIPDFFAKLKENGYEIILLLCSCPDKIRFESVNHRNKIIRFYQSSPEDAVSKGLLFPKRMEAYFKYADKMYFYWTDDVIAPERLAAVWADGKLEIHDSEALQRFIEKYEADRGEIIKMKELIFPHLISLSAYRPK